MTFICRQRLFCTTFSSEIKRIDESWGRLCCLNDPEAGLVKGTSSLHLPLTLNSSSSAILSRSPRSPPRIAPLPPFHSPSWSYLHSCHLHVLLLCLWASPPFRLTCGCLTVFLNILYTPWLKAFLGALLLQYKVQIPQPGVHGSSKNEPTVRPASIPTWLSLSSCTLVFWLQ